MNRKPKRATGFGLLAMSIAVFMTVPSANAAIFNVVGGQLLGAADVVVDGSLYDVLFVDGTCVDLFTGCDETADFVFKSFTEAEAASQAILDQVFVDGLAGQFDSDPSLTNGCDLMTVCIVLTPYGRGGVFAFGFRAGNVPIDSESNDGVGSTLISPGIDTTGTTGVFAVWSVVPEPGTAVLMGLGLLGRAARTRGQRRS